MSMPETAINRAPLPPKATLPLNYYVEKLQEGITVTPESLVKMALAVSIERIAKGERFIARLPGIAGQHIAIVNIPAGTPLGETGELVFHDDRRYVDSLEDRDGILFHKIAVVNPNISDGYSAAMARIQRAAKDEEHVLQKKYRGYTGLIGEIGGVLGIIANTIGANSAEFSFANTGNKNKYFKVIGPDPLPRKMAYAVLRILGGNGVDIAAVRIDDVLKEPQKIG